MTTRARDNCTSRVEHHDRCTLGQHLTPDDLQYCFGPQHRSEHIWNLVALANRQPHREHVHVQHRAPDQVADCGHAGAHGGFYRARIDGARRRRAERQLHVDHVLRGRIGQDDVRPRGTPFEQRARFRVEPLEVAFAQPRTRRQRVERSERSSQLRVHGGDDGAHRGLCGLDLLLSLGPRVVKKCSERQQDERQESGDDDPEQPPLQRTECYSSPQPLHVHLRVF